MTVTLDTFSNLPKVAYFSMEIQLDSSLPTYSGGLGVLAGDTLRAAADLGVPMVAIMPLHRKGYFTQRLDADGNQAEHPVEWSPEETLNLEPVTASVPIEGRTVELRAWRYDIRGISGRVVPVYLIDTALESNSEWDRTLTDHLYGGDDHYRLCQEAVLGLGGIAVLRALGLEENLIYHMNEGHSALLTLALLEQVAPRSSPGMVSEEEVEAVRRHCVFTTHTPVPAGHDQFPADMVRRVLGDRRADLLQAADALVDGMVNLTYLGLRFSRYINGVAMRHGEVSSGMFPEYPINAITNGVHALTWTSPPFRDLFDRHIPQWRHDNYYLHYARGIPLGEIWQAHAEAKRALLTEVRRRSGATLDESAMTLGFARRATTYKRAEMLFTDLRRLRSISREVGRLQIIYAGKAHPRDEGGKEIIRRIVAAAAELGDDLPVVYLEDYDAALAHRLCAGVDLWLNTPRIPQEASGTSGMKAALNGVPSFSVLDGWWVEGHIEGVTGWSIGRPEGGDDPAAELASLYEKLEEVIVPLFYGSRPAYSRVMRSAIALNGSFFNTQRMVAQYVRNAYYTAQAESSVR